MEKLKYTVELVHGDIEMLMNIRFHIEGMNFELKPEYAERLSKLEKRIVREVIDAEN